MLQSFEVSRQSWKRLFLFCLGLAAASAFCMKWMESDLWANGEKFTILGLELSYARQQMVDVFMGMNETVEIILRYHLTFDFAFMMGVYPGIAAACMLAKYRISSTVLRRVLIALAILQFVAWACDIIENYYLLKWIDSPTLDHFDFFHAVVYMKWIIAILAILIAGSTFFMRRAPSK